MVEDLNQQFIWKSSNGVYKRLMGLNMSLEFGLLGQKAVERSQRLVHFIVESDELIARFLEKC